MTTTPTKLSEVCNYSLEELRKRRDEISWVNLCAWRKFTQNQLRQFKDYIIWPLIAQQNNLSQSFIRQFIDYIDINDVVHYRELNLDFIREMYLKHNLQLINVITYGNLEWGSRKRNELINEYGKQFR